MAEARSQKLGAEVVAWIKAQQTRAYIVAVRQAAVAETGEIPTRSDL